MYHGLPTYNNVLLLLNRYSRGELWNKETRTFFNTRYFAHCNPWALPFVVSNKKNICVNSLQYYSFIISVIIIKIRFYMYYLNTILLKFILKCTKLHNLSIFSGEHASVTPNRLMTSDNLCVVWRALLFQLQTNRILNWWLYCDKTA